MRISRLLCLTLALFFPSALVRADGIPPGTVLVSRIVYCLEPDIAEKILRTDAKEGFDAASEVYADAVSKKDCYNSLVPFQIRVESQLSEHNVRREDEPTKMFLVEVVILQPPFFRGFTVYVLSPTGVAAKEDPGA